jgi:hypothetical protein
MEPGRGVAEAGKAGGGDRNGPVAEVLLGALKTASGQDQPDAGILALEAGGERSETSRPGVRDSLSSYFGAPVQIVETLGAAANESLQAIVDLSEGKSGKPLVREDDLIAQGAVYAGVKRLHALLNAMLRGSDQLGGGGGGRRAEIGDEVRDGEVGLVPNGGDDGQGGGGDDTGQGLVVEPSEVFQRASAAGYEDKVGFGDLLRGLAPGWGAFIEPANACGDRLGATLALDDRRIDDEI